MSQGPRPAASAADLAAIELRRITDVLQVEYATLAPYLNGVPAPLRVLEILRDCAAADSQMACDLAQRPFFDQVQTVLGACSTISDIPVASVSGSDGSSWVVYAMPKPPPRSSSGRSTPSSVRTDPSARNW